MLYQSNAERIYYTRNQKAKKQRESMEDRNYRLVQLYNKVFNAIGNMKSNKDYIPVRNLLNAFSHECGADSMSVFRLYKELEAKIQELLAENDTNLQKKQKEIEDVKNITITEPLEKLQQLELESNQILYSYMSQLHANGMQENTDRRRIGVWAKTPTRAEAMALQKLMALPQYANYFKENQKKVIFENAQNPDLIKHKKMVQPVIEKKQAELGLLFMQGFQLSSDTFWSPQTTHYNLQLFQEKSTIASQRHDHASFPAFYQLNAWLLIAANITSASITFLSI